MPVKKPSKTKSKPTTRTKAATKPAKAKPKSATKSTRKPRVKKVAEEVINTQIDLVPVQKLHQTLPNLKLKRSFKLAIYSVFVLLVLALTYMNIVYARPGDLFFFPRLLVERNYAANGGDVARVAVLENRFSSYFKLLSENNCVQAVLAANELNSKLREYSSHLWRENASPILLSTIAQYDVTKVQTNCLITIPAKEYRYLVNQKLFLLDNLNINVSLEAEEYHQISLNLVEESKLVTLPDQDLIDNFSEVLVAAQLSSPQNPVDLYGQVLLIYNAEAILHNDKFLNYEGLVQAVCILNSAEECDYAEISAQWNSINQDPNYLARLENGKLLANEYLQKLLPQDQ